MSKDGISITIDTFKASQMLQHLEKDKVEKAAKVVNSYTLKVAQEAKQIIRDYDYVDTGRLLTSVLPSLQMYEDRIEGKVHSGTEYAQTIHDGARWEGNQIVKYFVSFKGSPELLRWALRNDVIYLDGGTYRMVKNDSPVNIDKGGLRVRIQETKFFEKPYEKYKDKFVEELKNI